MEETAYLGVGSFYNLNSVCVNIRMIRTMRTVRRVHLTESRSKLEGKTAPSLILRPTVDPEKWLYITEAYVKSEISIRNDPVGRV